MRRRRSVLLGVAGLLAAADLALEAAAQVHGHARGPAFVAVALVLCGGVVAVVPRVPSLPLAVAGGVAVAGALGNLVSALAFTGGVPNPFTAGDVAFNLADVWVLLGSTALVLGAALYALRHPAELRRPV